MAALGDDVVTPENPVEENQDMDDEEESPEE